MVVFGVPWVDPSLIFEVSEGARKGSGNSGGLFFEVFSRLHACMARRRRVRKKPWFFAGDSPRHANLALFKKKATVAAHKAYNRLKIASGDSSTAFVATVASKARLGTLWDHFWGGSGVLLGSFWAAFGRSRVLLGHS